jgi:hypothetical protein
VAQSYEPGLEEGIKGSLEQPVIFDGRNLFESASVTALDIVYQGIGR